MQSDGLGLERQGQYLHFKRQSKQHLHLSCSTVGVSRDSFIPNPQRRPPIIRLQNARNTSRSSDISTFHATGGSKHHTQIAKKVCYLISAR